MSFPCRRCINFSVCGYNLRTEPCSRRKTYQQKKREERQEREAEARRKKNATGEDSGVSSDDVMMSAT